MFECPPVILLALWFLWIYQAFATAVRHSRFNRRLQKQVRPAFFRFNPKATVILPVKGADDDLQSLVLGLLQQDYPDYQVVFVVESVEDPAYAILKQLEQHDKSMRILIAGSSAPCVSQKVHNQLVAIDYLEPNCKDDEVWVFADSDITAQPYWLARLVGPLSRSSKNGVTTGYRWMVPAPDRKGNISLWSHLASICNSSVACQLRNHRCSYAWGGSMAMLVGTARRGGLRDWFSGAVSDDYQITRMFRDLNLRVYFVPQCLVASSVAMDCSGFYQFGRRQYLITRVYAPFLYIAALMATGLYVAGCLTSMIYLMQCLILGAGWLSCWFPVSAMVMVLSCNQIRSSLRARIVRVSFGTDIHDQLKRTLMMDRWLTPVWMTVHFSVILTALLGRTLCWRNVRYRLNGPQQIQRLPTG